MAELRDVLVRASDKTIGEAHVDNDCLEVVHRISYDESLKQLHAEGSDPDKGGESYSLDVPLDHVSGGDSRGELIATSSVIASSGNVSGALMRQSWSVDSGASARFSDGGSGVLRHSLSDAGGAGLAVDHDVDGFWVVPVRGATELWHYKSFVPFGPGGEAVSGAGANSDRESTKTLRFDDDYALLVKYSTDRESRYNDFYMQHPGGDWDANPGRSDYSVRLYWHNVVGPAGPAGGARPPFGEEDFTSSVRGKLDGAVSGVERTSGAGIKVSKNDGTSADVDVAPTRDQIASETGGFLADLDDQGNFTKYDSSGARSDGRLAVAGTPISVTGSFRTPVDSAAASVSFAAPYSANSVITRRLGALAGDDVSPYLVKSVVNGVGRVTFGRTGLASVSLTDVFLLTGATGSGLKEAVFVLQLRRAGGVQAQWTAPIASVSGTSSGFEVPITRTIGLLPVEAGDWLEVELRFSSNAVGGGLSYRLQGVYEGFDKAFAVNFFGSVVGAVASSTHTDAQIRQLADAEIVRAFGPHGLTWTRSPDAFGGVLKWAAANLDADTPAKRLAFRSALGLGDQEVGFLEDGSDLNALADSAFHPRLSKAALSHEPFPGPYLLFVEASSEGGTHDLRQWVWSLSQPGLSAHRELVSQASRPSSISSAWRVGHSFADLPALGASVSSVEVQALEDSPARWVANPVSVGMHETDGYLSGNVAAHGIGIIATNSAAFASAPGITQSGIRALADNQGKLMVQIQDSATEGWRAPSTFYWRASGSDERTEWESVPMSVLLDLAASNVFVSNQVLTQRQYSNLTGSVEAYFEYWDIEDRETVRVPGTLQPERLTLSKLRVPTSNGEISFPYSSPSQLRDGLQSLAGESRLDASAIKNIAASDTGADIVAKLQALAGAARLSASAIRDLPAPTAETAAQIVAKLEALQGANRLSAAAVKGLRSLVLESTADSAAKASLLDILGAAYSGTKLTDSGDIFGDGAIKTAAIGDDQITTPKLSDAVSDRLLPAATSADDGKVASVDASGDWHLVELASTEEGDPIGIQIATSSLLPTSTSPHRGDIPGITWTLNGDLEAGIYSDGGTGAENSLVLRAGPPPRTSMIGYVAELVVGSVVHDRGFMPFGPPSVIAGSSKAKVQLPLQTIVTSGVAKQVYVQQDNWDDGKTAISLHREGVNNNYPANSRIKIYEWWDTGASISDESVIDGRIARFARAGTADNLRRSQLAGIMDGDGTQAAADAMPDSEKLDYRFLKNQPDLILQGTKLPVEDRVPDNDVFNLEGDWEGYGPGLYRAVPTFLSAADRKSVSVRFNRSVQAHVYTWTSESVSDQWRIPEITISTSLAQGNPNQSIEAYLWSEHADGIDSIQLTFGTRGGNALWPNDGLSQTLEKSATTKTIGGRTAVRYLWETPTAAGTPGSLAPDNVDISVSSDHDLRAARAWSLDFPREEILDKVNETPGAVHREVVADIDRPIVYDSLGDAQDAMFGSPHVLATAAQNNRRTVRWLDSGRVREGVVKAEVPRGGSNGATTRRKPRRLHLAGRRLRQLRRHRQPGGVRQPNPKRTPIISSRASS